MSPQVAADAWKQYIQPLSNQGYQLLAPSTSSNPNGKTWTTQFFSLCNGCTVSPLYFVVNQPFSSLPQFDGIPIHYYDVTPQGFINYVTDFHTTFNLDIWPTEFACQASRSFYALMILSELFITPEFQQWSSMFCGPGLEFLFHHHQVHGGDGLDCCVFRLR